MRKGFKKEASKCRIIYLLFFMLIMGTLFISGFSWKRKESGKITIRFANWEVLPVQLRTHEKVIRLFEKEHPNIKVQFEPVQGGPLKILVEIAGGRAPDVFYWHQSLLAPLVEKKAVLDLSPFIKRDRIDLDAFFSPTIQAMRFEEGIYGMPIYFGMYALVYNRDLFDKAGIKYPDDKWTWSDFLEAAKKLTLRKGNKVVQYGAKVGAGHIAAAFGAKEFDEEGNCLYDTPKMREALQFYYDLLYKYKVMPLPGVSVSQLAEGARSDLEMFMTGKLGMFLAPAFLLPELRKIKNFSWDVAPIPLKEGGYVTYSTGCLVISSKTKYPEEAWELVKFVTGERAARIYAQQRMSIPARRKIAEEIFLTPPPEHIKVFLDQIKFAKAYNFRFPWYQEFSKSIKNPEIELLSLNKQDVERTVKNIQQRFEKFIKRYREE